MGRVPCSPFSLDPSDSPPRRIALVITRSDAVGGAQVHVQLLAQGLREAGHTAVVFVGGHGPYCERLQDAHVPFVSLSHLGRALRPVKDVRAAAQLLAALREFGPDLVSTHSTKAGWIGRLAARWMGVPSLFTAHGWPLSPGRLAPERRWVRRAEQVCAAASDGLILVSDYDRRVAVEHGIGLPHQHVVVHNALPDVPAELRADPSQSPPHVVMVARLGPPKSPLLALEALAEIVDVPWRFTLVGDGPEREAVHRRVWSLGLAQRVDLPGAVDDVASRLAVAELFVLASRREGLPVSVLEAMRAGLPVVSTHAGGVSEAVIDGLTGFVTPRDDAPALARALRALLTSSSKRQQMGAAGRRRFEEAFSFAPHLRRTWAVFARAMQEGRAR